MDIIIGTCAGALVGKAAHHLRSLPFERAVPGVALGALSGGLGGKILTLVGAPPEISGFGPQAGLALGQMAGGGLVSLGVLLAIGAIRRRM
ncbi:hypothetical protein [Tropicibacter naphthalenivorans]|uniref:Uncharacterized protein n=1 Tax=Tropicibacter naphthalenivorans TaxID=441103 RepID=A0A0P1GKE2_9RHOB|nr:hypothetical protein [Tropicibacter naphthalenivorans]CUH82606.1 hypothetical protein TRN7648_04148 [Tropicibacter naphthalenivorans]SMD09613.1 hypothetical protein SAMN04488093_11939 [Tropicibacter naphthalenivorans]